MALWKSEAAQGDIAAFALETATDQEIHVRHRASGHVLRFVRSESGAIADLHRIDLDFSSSFDGRDACFFGSACRARVSKECFVFD